MNTNDASRASGLFDRRQSGTRLDPLHIPALDASEPVRYLTSLDLPSWQKRQKQLQLKDVEDEGQCLFQNFLKDQIENDHTVSLDEEFLSTLSGYKNDLWVKDGLDFRIKAGAFAITKERKSIRECSSQVDLNMSHSQFKQFLSQFHHENELNLQRVLVLFFLCSDVTIAALKTGMELFQQYLLWSLQFIKSSVSWWVYHQGGWSEMLKTPVHPIFKACLWIAVSAVVIITFIRLNKLKES